MPGFNRSVDLVGRDLNHSVQRASLGCFHQSVSAVDVGVDEFAGVEERPIDMGFSCKVDRGVHLAGQSVDKVQVGHVALHKGEPRVGLEVRQVLAPAGVGKLVQHGDGPIFVSSQGVANEVGTDEAGAPGD